MRKGKKTRVSGREVRRNVERAAEIFGQYADDIQAMIRFQVEDESQIDDIFQNLFLSLVNKPIPSSITNIKGYLYRAVTHDVIDSSRRTRSYQNQASRLAEYRQYKVVEETPHSTVVELEEAQRLFDLVEENLPVCEAQAVVLTCADNLDAGQAAKRMGVNRRTVSRYKCVGLKKIRRCLLEEGYLEDYVQG
ncbi:MAG TPA: RNA polymerase sigma factor [Sedimentisphaerales bacterium]|nr:RNA polymerase sigma factor [Sedimentisphaerales bacterium]